MNLPRHLSACCSDGSSRDGPIQVVGLHSGGFARHGLNVSKRGAGAGGDSRYVWQAIVLGEHPLGNDRVNAVLPINNLRQQPCLPL